jgi:hypothetical protein
MKRYRRLWGNKSDFFILSSCVFSFSGFGFPVRPWNLLFDRLTELAHEKLLHLKAQRRKVFNYCDGSTRLHEALSQTVETKNWIFLLCQVQFQFLSLYRTIHSNIKIWVRIAVELLYSIVWPRFPIKSESITSRNVRFLSIIEETHRSSWSLIGNSCVANPSFLSHSVQFVFLSLCLTIFSNIKIWALDGNWIALCDRRTALPHKKWTYPQFQCPTPFNYWISSPSLHFKSHVPLSSQFSSQIQNPSDKK